MRSLCRKYGFSEVIFYRWKAKYSGMEVSEARRLRELEEQNRGLLRSMNRRARLQLRLQQTVEGLSVAAVSYYVVGLVSYLAKGVKDLGLPIAPSLVAAASVPFVVLGIWWIVHRVRKRFARKDEPDV